MKQLIIFQIVVACLVLIIANATAQDKNKEVATLRGYVPIETQAKPQAIPKVVNSDVKKTRNYPMQPPLIPHTIRDYQVDLNVNKCLSCHSRSRTEESQAPMISVTHFMDRDGNFLAEVSPRRYFCSQCHVTQKDVKPLVANTFVDMKQLMKEKQDSNQ